MQCITALKVLNTMQDRTTIAPALAAAQAAVRQSRRPLRLQAHGHSTMMLVRMTPGGGSALQLPTP